MICKLINKLIIFLIHLKFFMNLEGNNTFGIRVKSNKANINRPISLIIIKIFFTLNIFPYINPLGVSLVSDKFEFSFIFDL